MRRAFVAAGIVLAGLGLALYFSLSRTQVARTLARGEPVHLLWLVRLLPEDPPDFALAITLHPGGWVSWVLVPGTLAVPASGAWTTLRALPQKDGVQSWARCLSGLLGLTFFRAVEVPLADWERLVEAAGGVTVRPKERLFYRDPTRGLLVDFPPGEQLVFGARAREFLAYCLRYAGDPSFSLALGFLRDLVARLWFKGGKETAGALAGDWETRSFWQRALSVPLAAVEVELLPAVAEDTRLMPDLVRIRKLRERIVSGRVFLVRDEVRIVVLNGTREKFLATRTAAWLTARGFKVSGVGSADRTDYTKTFLVVGAGAEEKAKLLRDVLPKDTVVITAQAFGVERLGRWPEEADLVLVVGAGFEVGP